jgi:predicted AlkP superfamily phosphohydrolase/phosphomutase
MTEQRKILAIGIDAAEISLIQRWNDDGHLPTLRKLKQEGAFGPLSSTAEWLVGSPWPSFYTSTPPSEHGMYHYLIWRPERMATERPSSSWMPLEPFWRSLDALGKRVVAVDMPLAYAPGPFKGIEISGWATHEVIEPPASYPPELLDEVTERFGKPPFANEETYLLSVSELLGVRDQCIRTTEMIADLGITLMEESPWDLFLLGFAAAHRGGHQLWDLTGVAGEVPPNQVNEVKDALKQVYIACDKAIGRLIEKAGDDTTVLVFSLHGMGPNASRSELLREMLDRILAENNPSAEPAPANRLSKKLRTLLPIRFRSWVKNRLPITLQDRLTLFWRTGGIDWRSTRAFAAFCDLDGYIRINLKGREAQGIVEPGKEYDDLCEHISNGLRTFVDEDTGQAIVDRIGRLDSIYPTGSMRKHLPDLMVHWVNGSASAHRRVVSPQYGAIAWPTPGSHPQGRSGNHLPTGFLFARSDSIPAGARIDNANILDLAPSIFKMMDLPVPTAFHGKSLF